MKKPRTVKKREKTRLKNLTNNDSISVVEIENIPEITLFRSFYYKHTPFAIESIYSYFDTSVGFGIESTAIIQPLGDLVNKTYLEITLPEISLKRTSTSISNVEAYKIAVSNLEIVKSFGSINRNAFIKVNEIYESVNITNPQFIVEDVNSVFNDVSVALTIQSFKNVLLTKTTYPYSQISLQDIVNNLVIDDSTKEDYYNESLTGINKFIIVQKIFFDEMNRLKALVDDDKNENLKFAWVDNLGFAIIKSVEIVVNGKVIDKHTGEWMKIQSELSQETNKNKLLDKMIGNIPELTTFDRTTKPKYTLLVPLRFWFCEQYKLSMPVLALKSNQVLIRVTFRKIEEVSYIENEESIFRGLGKETISLQDVPETLKLNIQSRLLIDYVFLSSMEKQKFTKNNYQYMIETVQQIVFQNVIDPKIMLNLNPFVGVNSAFIWTAQKLSQKSNITGFNKTQIVNFSKNSIEGNPIKYSSIIFGDFFRCPKLHYSYYNYTIPYDHYPAIPSDGVNVFSFAILPNPSQPSGHCVIENNIKRAVLQLEFDDELLSPNNKNKLAEKYTVIVYAKKINIFRIKDGFHRLTFN